LSFRYTQHAFRKTHAEEIPFALALVAKRLKTPWQLIRLATKAAPTKNAADVAATPYAIVVPMVLDRLSTHASTLAGSAARSCCCPGSRRREPSDH
jgi:hypothetical protein